MAIYTHIQKIGFGEGFLEKRFLQNIDAYRNAPAEAVAGAENDVNAFLTARENLDDNLDFSDATTGQLISVLGTLQEPDNSTGKWTQDHFPAQGEEGHAKPGKHGIERAIQEGVNRLLRKYGDGKVSLLKTDGRIMEYNGSVGKNFLQARLNALIIMGNKGVDRSTFGKSVNSYDFLRGLQVCLASLLAEEVSKIPDNIRSAILSAPSFENKTLTVEEVLRKANAVTLMPATEYTSAQVKIELPEEGHILLQETGEVTVASIRELVEAFQEKSNS